MDVARRDYGKRELDPLDKCRRNHGAIFIRIVFGERGSGWRCYESLEDGLIDICLFRNMQAKNGKEVRSRQVSKCRMTPEKKNFFAAAASEWANCWLGISKTILFLLWRVEKEVNG